jgi:hypothetical protein
MFIDKIIDKKFVCMDYFFYLCTMKTNMNKIKKTLTCKIGLHKYGEWGAPDAFDHVHLRRCKKCNHLHWKK